MIADRIEDSETYGAAGSRLEKALAWLRSTDTTRLEVGSIEIEGDEIYALIQEYMTEAVTDWSLEFHERYADIQYVIEGCELIYWESRSRTRVSIPYDASRDVGFCEAGTPKPTYLRAGDMCVLFPQDAHRPKCRWQPDTAEKVRKVVIKVLVA
jgi:YhcH/YjgK/YiaL family protein